MRVTHRRHNIGEAYKLCGQAWVTLSDLQSKGAYGSRQSIHKAMIRMMNYEAVIMKPTIGGNIYRITAIGLTQMGMVPEKMHD